VTPEEEPTGRDAGDLAGDGNEPDEPELDVNLDSLGLPRWFQTVLTVACIVTVPAAIFQFDGRHSGGRDVAAVISWATWAVFVIAIGVSMLRAPSFGQWLRKNPLDVAVLVLSVPLFPLPMQLLRGVWLFRFVRAKGFTRFVFSGQAIRYTIVALVLAVLGGGSLFAGLEHIKVGTGIYWAVTTVTTVGYGDVTPTTAAGRVLAMIVMSVGIVSLGFLTAAASERWMANARKQADAKADTEESIVLDELRQISARLTAIEQRLESTPKS
jgi:voltage-gated potassium channel